MRSVAVICGVQVLILVGGGAWVYTRPPAPETPIQLALSKALPTDAQPARSAATAEDSAPISRVEVNRLLRAGDFARLTRIVESKQAKAARDIRSENEIGAVLESFRTAELTLTPFLDAWVAAEPASYAPLLARAEHRFALAFARRGTKTAFETTKEQAEGMEVELVGAVADARAVLERDARVGEAYRVLVDSARAMGAQDACSAFAQRGLEKMPASLRIRSALAICELPRWGGSYPRVNAVALEADAHVKDNPALKSLHGFAAWDRGRLAQGDKALEYYAEALAAGEHPYFYRDRASEHLRQKHYAEALADTGRALALRPGETDTLLLRARALVGLDRIADAGSDMQLLQEVDATDEGFAAFKQYALETAADEGYQLLENAKDVNGAIDRLTEAVDLVGGNAEVYYWRGRAHLKTGGYALALADFKEAVGLDARHFESYRNIDYILARQRDWDGVIRHWTQYIESGPADGRAYLERGGAHKHNGDLQAALADVRRACDLGTKEACGIVKRQGR